MRPEWLTPKEVALRLGCDPETVRRWHRAGILQSHQPEEGGAIYFRWPLGAAKPKPDATPDDT